MAIKTTFLKQLNKTSEDTKEFTYKDLYLDLTKDDRQRKNLFENAKVLGKDVLASYDEEAIKNSLRNLFNTQKGQRFLFPLYGLDLYQFVFEPVSQRVGTLLGKVIYDAITDFEPRVKVLNVNVKGFPDENKYEIEIVVEIPLFDKSANESFRGIFDLRSQSFSFL